MKKITILLIFLTLSFTLFAETGFNGFQWGAEKKDVIIPNNPDYAYKVFNGKFKNEDFAIADTVHYSSQLFGGSFVFYHFHNGFNIREDNNPGLYAVSSSVSKSDIDYIKRKYEDKKIFETEVAPTTLNELKRNGANLGDGAFYDYFMNNHLAMSSLAGFLRVAGMGYSWQGAGHIAVFEYNDDSAICTFSNVIEGTNILMVIAKKHL